MPNINTMYKTSFFGLNSHNYTEMAHVKEYQCHLYVQFILKKKTKMVLKCSDIILPVIFDHACLGNPYLAYKHNHFPPYKPKQACQEQTSYSPPPRCYSWTLFKASIGFKAPWFVWSLNHKCNFTSSHSVCQLSCLSFCFFKLVNDNEVLHGLPESFF